MATDNRLDNVRGRALGAVLRNALFSWQSLFTVAITSALFIAQPDISVIPGWQPWFWLVGGAVAEAAWILSSLSDPEASRAAVAREFQRRFDINQINNRVARQRLKDALEYRTNMLGLVQGHGGAMRMSLEQTVDDIDDWLQHMFDLAQHIDTFDGNDLIERDLRQVPQQIKQTQARIELERDPQVKADLQQKLVQLEQQRANLDSAANSVKRAEIQLESTLTALGTIYAQMSVLGTKDVDSARAQRLRLEIQDEVASLQDTIEAMDEVQSQRLVLR